MPAANHPAYAEELERCRYTLDYVEKTLESTLGKKEKVDRDVESIKKHFNSESSQNYIDLMINTLLQDTMALKLRNLVTAKSKPYFARVDFAEKDKKEGEKLYIGKMSLMREEDQQVIIVDWRAPVANLYYEERLGDARYICPDGDVKGQMLLKRQFSINGGELQEIFDIDITTNDEFLQAYLGAGADNRLKEIVSTIQVEQNRIIRADMWTPMVVQGAAGSGKTTIALHRIAYLIYTYEKDFKPENFMIIAPSRFFLNYISEVLPELGVERVLQSTFESFAMDLLGKKFKVKDPNEKLVSFVSETGGSTKAKDSLLFKASELKASMKFKEIMDRYVEYVEARFIPREDFKLAGVTVYTYMDINRLFLKEYKRWPVAKRIDEIKKHLSSRLKILRDKIVNSLYDECDEKIAQLKETMEDNEERHRLIVEAIDNKNDKIGKVESNSKRAVNEYVKRLSNISPWQYYVNFMENIPLAMELSKGIADRGIVEYMVRHTCETIRSGFIEIEDFAPLIYLKFLIYGMDEKIPVKHIVIDEAQDFSVFQLYVLRKIIKDSSFTILGDLCQGIHAYRGLKDWKDVMTQVFDDRRTEYLNLEQSYRTTVEIMDAANLVIRRLPEGEHMQAKPVIRHGEPVRLLNTGSLKETAADICGRLEGVRKEGLKSVAIICKTLDECKSIQAQMKKTVPELYIITGKEDQYKGGIVTLPSYLSKGLEFDAVFIVGAETYGEEDLDIKLLYVCMTRALHKLYVYYNGESTSLLAEMGRLG